MRSKNLNQIDKNIRANSLNGIFNSISQNAVLPFLGVYLRDLGANSLQFGLLSSLPALVATFSLLPGLNWLERQKDKVHFISLLTMASRLFYFLFILGSFLAGGVWIVLAFYALSALPWTWSSLAWKSLIWEAIPASDRGGALAQRNLFISIFAILTTLFAGALIDYLGFPVGYQVIFAFSFLISFLEVYFLLQMKPLTEDIEPPEEKGTWKIIWQNPLFRNFCIGSLIFQIGYQGTLPLFTIFTVKDLGATPLWVSLIAIASGIGQISTYSLWARWEEKWGQEKILILATFLISLSPLFYAVSHSLLVVTLFNFLIGFSWAGFNLLSLNYLLAISPFALKERFIMVYNLLMNFFAIFLPLLGIALSGLIGIRLAFIVGTVFRAGGGFFFLFRLPWREKNVAQ